MNKLFVIIVANILIFNVANSNEVITGYETSKGTLKLIELREKPSNFIEYSISLNGKVIVISDSQIKKIIGAYPETKPTIFIVKVITGGSGCPATYLVIDLNSPKSIVKELFANCSDIAKVKYYPNNVIKMTNGGEKWNYENGEIIKQNLTEKDIAKQKLWERIQGKK